MPLTFIDRTCSAYFIARNMSWISNGISFLKKREKKNEEEEMNERNDRTELYHVASDPFEVLCSFEVIFNVIENRARKDDDCFVWT